MKMICIGRNYAQHAAELKNAVPTEPVIFMKPETALAMSNVIGIPGFTHDLHYECELVLRIGKEARNIAASQALDYVDALTLGIDFTARDLQEMLKENKLPWERAKAFDGSAVVGKWQPVTDFPTLEAIDFRMLKNGEMAQQGSPKDMIFSIPKILEFASVFFTLMPGDLIFTGTPAGVGPVHNGDWLTGYLNQTAVFDVRMAS